MNSIHCGTGPRAGARRPAISLHFDLRTRWAWHTLLALCAALLLLAACGGGGGSSAPVAPAVTTQPASATVSAGQSAPFSVAASGSDPLAYQWQRNGIDVAGATSASLTVSAAAADNGALYTVVVSNAAGSATSNAATLTVNAVVAPAITTQPVAASATVGSPATFTVVASGSGPLAYQWRRNASDIAGATGASYTLAAAALADNAAAFSVRVSNAGGDAISTDAVLTVTAAVVAPAITTQPANQTVNAGQSATFSVVATGSAPLAYQWRKNGVNVAGATAASYTTAATVDADNGARFSVVVSNASPTTATSSEAVLSVTPVLVAPAITTQPANASVNVGASATFSVVATGSAPLAYQWRRNASPIAGANAASYTTPAAVASDDAALFSVIVSNGAGSVTSGDAALTVLRLDIAALRFPRLVVGWDAFSTLVRKADGSLWGWGQAAEGQLGPTATANIASPSSLIGPGTVVAMGAGRYTSTLVQPSGTLLTSGLQRNGVLGNGAANESRQYRFDPASLIPQDAVWVATGNSASVAIRRDGTAWQWGSTLVNPAYGPGGERVGMLTRVVAAALGQGGFKFALRADGTLWFWGRNVDGIAAGATAGLDSALPLRVPGIDRIATFASGAGHVLAVRTDGTVWSWGWAAQGQLGYAAPTTHTTVPQQVPGLTDVVAVAGGWTHSLALRRDGSVWAWGENLGSQLCLGTRTSIEAPQPIPGLSGVTDIAAGQEHSVFVKADGSVSDCGLSINESLGIPGVTRAMVPTQVPGINLN